MKHIPSSNSAARMLRTPLLLAAFAISGAAADAIVEWNAITNQAIATAITAGRPGPATFMDFAVVHLAMHDAVQAIEGKFQPYETRIPNATGSAPAAAAKAARDVLASLFPAQTATIDMAYVSYLAANQLTASDPGIAVGQRAASGILARRTNDGSYPMNPAPFVGSTEAGAWRPTPSYLPGAPTTLAPMAIPWMGSVTPLTLRSPAQFRATPPPQLNSRRYTRDYDEVKSLGGFSGSDRTPEQTGMAYFWSDNYAAQWNRALRAISERHLSDNLADSARLFALVNVAMADSIIVSWESKLHFNYWRPVTAIQEGENDGNPGTVGDPNWQPLVNTPNYPDYTSGANNVTGACTRMLALFFGTDRVTFTVTSNVAQASPNTRTFNRFSDAADAVVDARILLGFHFRFADTAARRQGTQVANWVFRRFLRPVE